MFTITRGSGFHMKFANGWTVSVQWGAGNYCDHYMKRIGGETHGPSATAEVGTWKEGGKPMEVVGYQTPEQIAKIIAAVSRRKA